MTTNAIKVLREAESKATKGPWECAWFAQRHPVFTVESTLADTDGKTFGIYGAEMNPLNTDASADLAVLVRNCLPELLSVVEAADELSVAINSLRFNDYGCNGNIAEAESIAEAQDKLDAALARLEQSVGEVGNG